MISLVFQFTLFFLVLFVVVPGVVISFRVFWKHYHHQKHAGWQKGNPANLAG